MNRTGTGKMCIFTGLGLLQLITTDLSFGWAYDNICTLLKYITTFLRKRAGAREIFKIYDDNLIDYWGYRIKNKKMYINQHLLEAEN
jgi:hypothetical protein